MADDKSASEILEETGRLYERYLKLARLTDLPKPEAPRFSAPQRAPMGLVIRRD